MKSTKLAFTLTHIFTAVLTANSLLGDELGNIERFKLTTKPQEAVFFVGVGWTGSAGGSMPLLDLKTERPKEFEGLPIFLDSSRVQEVEQKLPSCFSGIPLVKVAARIHLVKRRARNYSIEGAPYESFYEAVIDKIRSVEIKADPCD